MDLELSTDLSSIEIVIEELSAAASVGEVVNMLFVVVMVEFTMLMIPA